jgi:hypothetical protein
MAAHPQRPAPQSDRARALAGQGIEIAQGGMNDLASLQKAMAGVRGVYSVQDYFTVGTARDVGKARTWPTPRSVPEWTTSCFLLSAA